MVKSKYDAKEIREKLPQIFEQVKRPTFSNPYLKLKEEIINGGN